MRFPGSNVVIPLLVINRISASFRHRNLHVVSTGEEGAVEGGPPRQDLRAAHRPELLDPRKRRWPPVELPKYPGDVH